MNIKSSGLSLFGAVLVLAILMASCTTAFVQTNPTPQPVLKPTPTIINEQVSSVIAAAKSALAEKLQVSVDGIQFVDIQQVQWPDGCLGVQQPGIMCAMHVVDGYRIMLLANDQSYEVRSNLDGSQTALPLENASSSAPIKIGSGGLQIADFSSSIGGVDGNPDQQLVSYTVTIFNASDGTVTLLWLEPILQDSISGRAADSGLRHEINEVIAPNSQLDIHGQLTLSTSGLTKQDMTQLGSLFRGFTVSTNQTIPLPQS